MFSAMLSDILLALTCAFLTVCTLGIILAVGFAWEAVVSWIFRIPRN